MSKKSQVKIYKKAKNTLCIRKGRIVTYVSDGVIKTFDYVNQAKRFCRKIVEEHGLGAVRVER